MYKVIVVGGGHAGAEAAAASANMGVRTLLVTMNLQTIGQMSCNPAMGGVAKGQIIREIDALGGQSAVVTDKSAVQFRMLNRSKGPAVWSPRAQSDRMRFAECWREMLEKLPNLDFYQDMVVDLIIEGETIKGVVTGLGVRLYAEAVIITGGTFLNGTLHIGEKQLGGGRAGEKAAYGITEKLEEHGFESGRMKTGTPPRIDGRTLDLTRMEEQKGDEEPGKFSFDHVTKPLDKQLSCFITYTNPTVHEILAEGFERSPMYNGAIKSKGPRYCPSIEDKISRFTDKDRHQIFAEPEGWRTIEMYMNGFSTSLPQEVQVKAMREIKGFENVKIFRPGYAIEYDYFPPKQLKRNLETSIINGLYFAGQINGTTGYEEAACQGLIAGINSALKVLGKEPLILKRNEAYIGVLIDDLITKGTDEPYRMFTSRAEHRIWLRQDNADERLRAKGYELGLVSERLWKEFNQKMENKSALRKFVETVGISPQEAVKYMPPEDKSAPKQQVKLKKFLVRPNMGFKNFKNWPPLKDYISARTITDEVIEGVEIELKYDGYVRKEQEQAEKMLRLSDLRIPHSMDFWSLKMLSSEAREKFTKAQPATIGEAQQISGVKASDVAALLTYLNR